MKTLERLQITPRHGDEKFHLNGAELGFSLEDFWRWSVSDLVSNVTRGRLAEFIVAKALDISTTGVRDEWGAFDLTAKSGLKIEVKSAAYIQSWNQKRLSLISFLVPKTKYWDAESNLQSNESKRQADVYVFALLAHQEKRTIDPLDMTQWRFYVLPTATLDGRTRSQHSILLKTLEKLSGGSVDYYQLKELVERIGKGAKAQSSAS